MDRLKELLQSFWLKVVAALQNFENSPLFERIMRRYEAMTPGGQSAFKSLAKLGTLVIIALMILGGPFLLLSKLNDIKNLENLESEAATFQAEYEAQTKGFTPPSGWRPLNANSAQDLASAFNEYLPGIGVPEEFGNLVATGDSLNLVLKEISIRQATNILFQLEGLYPKVQTQTLKIRPNAGQRDILDMDATFKFNPAFASQVSTVTEDLNSGAEDNSYPSPRDLPPPPSNNNTTRNTPNLPNNNVESRNDEYPNNNDYIPPPPPPTDYDDIAPPDFPDDLPPPPPPPGFEEEP